MNAQTMKASITRWGWTLSIFLLVSYLICVAFGLLILQDSICMRHGRRFCPALNG